MTLYDSLLLLSAVAVSCIALAIGICLIAFGIAYSALSWVEHKWPLDSRPYTCVLLLFLGGAFVFVYVVAQFVFAVYQYELHRSIL